MDRQTAADCQRQLTLEALERRTRARLRTQVFFWEDEAERLTRGLEFSRKNPMLALRVQVLWVTGREVAALILRDRCRRNGVELEDANLEAMERAWRALARALSRRWRGRA